MRHTYLSARGYSVKDNILNTSPSQMLLRLQCATFQTKAWLTTNRHNKWPPWKLTVFLTAVSSKMLMSSVELQLIRSHRGAAAKVQQVLASVACLLSGFNLFKFWGASRVTDTNTIPQDLYPNQPSVPEYNTVTTVTLQDYYNCVDFYLTASSDPYYLEGFLLNAV